VSRATDAPRRAKSDSIEWSLTLATLIVRLVRKAGNARRTARICLWLAVSLVSALAAAQTLPLAPELISLNSEAGERLLLESHARRPYIPLTINFVTQKTQSYCAIASIAMVLNALGVQAPDTPEYAPYRIYTQDNVLNATTERILPQAVLLKRGTTLDQLGALFESHGVEATVKHASDVSVESFRKEAADYLSRPNHYVIVNYLRRQIAQERGGHISPLAAYDSKTDRFLILDVARYKYPPVWVKSADLFAAMNTPDAANENKSRGFVLVRRSR
jgi:glutathione-S-conjugate glycine hydrolase